MMTTSAGDRGAAMTGSVEDDATSLGARPGALQQRPRPHPLFLAMPRSEPAADPGRMQRALAGLRRYQESARPPIPPPMPAVAEAGGAVLRNYGGAGPPVVFI